LGGERLPERPADCPGFTRVWMASTISGFGTYVTTLAIQVLIVLTLNGGAGGVGLVNAARWLPCMLFGLIAGVLVDRSRRRPLLVGTDLARGLLLIGVPVLAVMHQLSIVVLMGFMAVFGLMSLIHDAAFQSFLPRLVPSSLLTAANARLDQSDALAQTSGPALAGGLVSLLGAPWAVLVDAASYVLSGVVLLRIPVVEPPRSPLSIRGIGREATEGLRWVYLHATLRPLALSTHAWFVCSAVVNAVLPPYALRTLGLSPFGLGARFGCGRVVVACRASTALAWALIALSTEQMAGWVVFGGGQLLLGLSLGAENANEMGYRQVVTPDRLQGRMNATMRSINRAMIVIGAPVGGVLGDAIGYRPMIWAAAGGFLTVSIALALSPFRKARIA
jgi:MFS family permease